MQEIEEGGQKAFSTFRVLNGDGTSHERDHLFRNMAQLFSFVSDRCDDDQVEQYDTVLCQLAELVEVEARSHVARLLAPLDRAPGTVVVKLANDDIAVARPLLEFSNVLSDDDLIEIAASKTEDHRVAIAGRAVVPSRVGEAIVQHGGVPSVGRLVQNANAEIGEAVLEKLVAIAAADAAVATDLRGRQDIDWTVLSGEIAQVAARVLQTFMPADKYNSQATISRINAVVYNRLRNRAGFNSHEWKVAYNQVKALSDRRQLDDRALARFARFGYGHHTAAALTQQLRLAPEVLVKWLAMQDYAAITVALRTTGMAPDLFESIVAVMPWRDVPTESDKMNVRARFEAIGADEASDIFELWRAHSFRKRNSNANANASAERQAVGAA